MAYQKLTLADCKQSLADRMTNGVIPSDSSTLSYWIRLINRGVVYCADRLRISKSITLTTTGGTANLPDDFITTVKVYDSANNKQTKVDQDDIEKHTGSVYWISGNHFDGFDLNVPTDGTFTVNYSFRPAPMVNDSDVCIIPDIEAPVAFAYSAKRKAESDPFEDSMITMQECETRLKELQSAYSINTDSIDFDWE